MKQHILSLTPTELKQAIIELGEPAYRADQVSDWIYRKLAQTPQEMSNLPAPLRKRLAEAFDWTRLNAQDHQHSAQDDSTKYLFKLADGQFVETVFIPHRDRRTICISSQVGCKFHCAFCASGQAGFFRNLTVAEIVDQILQACRDQKTNRPTHLVLMGIGEPLDNYEAVVKAIRILNDPRGLALGARRITLSTCGVVPQIEQLAKEGIQMELSISLHGVDDAVRGDIMPVNRRWNVNTLLTAARQFNRQTRRLITFEYILIDGVNASPEHAQQLVRRLKRIPCKINLIPYNPIAEYPQRRPTEPQIRAFARVLKEGKITATVRYSKGGEVNAACGQLRSKLL